MVSEGPDRILKGLREHSGNDEVLEKFLICIFNKELQGIHFWKKEYEKKLTKYCQSSWGENYED